MEPIEIALRELKRSTFRRRFRLGPKELQIVRTKSLATVLDHARDIIRKRLAPAEPLNDGKQTPMRGHPVFVAQHATATCCRGCLAKWHGISKGKRLSDEEQSYAVAIIGRWIEEQLDAAGAQPAEPDPQERLL